MAALETALARARRPGAHGRRRRRAAARRVGRVPARCARSIASSLPAGVGAAVAYAANPIARERDVAGRARAARVASRSRRSCSRALVRARPTKAATHAGHGCRTRCSSVAPARSRSCASVWPPGRRCSRSSFAVAFVVAVPFARDAPLRRSALRSASAAARDRGRGRADSSPWVWSLSAPTPRRSASQPRAPAVARSMLQFHFDVGPARASAPGAPRGGGRAARDRERAAARVGDPRVDARRCSRSPRRGCRARISPTRRVPAPDGVAGPGRARARGRRRARRRGRVSTTCGSSASAGGRCCGRRGGRASRSRCSGSRPTPPRVVGSSRAPTGRRRRVDERPAAAGRLPRAVARRPGDRCPSTPRSSAASATGSRATAPATRARCGPRPSRPADRVSSRARSPPRRRATPRGSVTCSRRSACATSRSSIRAAPGQRRRGRRPDPALGDALARQLDLTRLARRRRRASSTTNDAWIPRPHARAARPTDVHADAADPAGRGTARRARRRPGRRSRAGAPTPIGPGTLLCGRRRPTRLARVEQRPRRSRRRATRSAGRTRSRSTRRGRVAVLLTPAARARVAALGFARGRSCGSGACGGVASQRVATAGDGTRVA